LINDFPQLTLEAVRACEVYAFRQAKPDEIAAIDRELGLDDL
jgi:uncharacterized protein (DUF433 family)